jgi:2'-5' RNA ligase
MSPDPANNNPVRSVNQIRSGNKVRSFVAVPLPAALQVAVLGTAHSLAARLPDIKWSRKAENLHVTLTFLGQVDRELLARFTTALGSALGARPRFEIHLRGVGAFPSLRNAQVIWVGIDDPSRQLGEIARIVGEVADQLAVGESEERRRRPFSAHVTIGRTPRRSHGAGDVTAALAPFADRAFGGVSVSEVHVYESITGGDASTYVLRGTAMLEGATHGDGKERDQGSN